MFTLNAKTRDIKNNLDKLRKVGELPAVFYGMGNASTSISIPNNEFKKIWKRAGESSTIKIITSDGSFDVLIHDVQVDPITEEPLHVDFLVIDLNKSIKVAVPLDFIGISDAVKNGLGVLVKVLHEIDIEALPKDIPHTLSVDISSLTGLDSQILVSDIVLPKGVKMITKEDEVVASIATQKEEKEETIPVDLSSIEVEKKGKKEETENSIENTEESK